MTGVILEGPHTPLSPRDTVSAERQAKIDRVPFPTAHGGDVRTSRMSEREISLGQEKQAAGGAPLLGRKVLLGDLAVAMSGSAELATIRGPCRHGCWRDSICWMLRRISDQDVANAVRVLAAVRHET
jgi:hypothetical protein